MLLRCRCVTRHRRNIVLMSGHRLPSKHEAFTQWCFNATLKQHWVNASCLLGGRWPGNKTTLIQRVVRARTLSDDIHFNTRCYQSVSHCDSVNMTSLTPQTCHELPPWHSRSRRFERNKNVSSPSTCESQYCGEPPWPRGSVLGLRPPGLEFRILCLEDSVISIISPSSGGSPGPV